MSDAVHAILSSGEVVGHSAWTWDPLYRPVMGCFAGGALVAAAACDQPPDAAAEPAAGGIAARVSRRIGRAAGLAPPARKPPFEGPAEPVWFRMSLPPALEARLRAGDPAVTLARLEDGAPSRLFAGADAGPGGGANRSGSVESLLGEPPGPPPEPLDGFAAFLTLPPLHQLEMVFMEYLRRLPEAEGRRVYLPGLEAGDTTALGLRDILLASDEFKARRIGHGSRLGCGLVSTVWRRVALQPHLTAGG